MYEQQMPQQPRSSNLPQGTGQVVEYHSPPGPPPLQLTQTVTHQWQAEYGRHAQFQQPRLPPYQQPYPEQTHFQIPTPLSQVAIGAAHGYGYRTGQVPRPIVPPQFSSPQAYYLQPHQIAALSTQFQLYVTTQSPGGYQQVQINSVNDVLPYGFVLSQMNRSYVQYAPSAPQAYPNPPMSTATTTPHTPQQPIASSSITRTPPPRTTSGSQRKHHLLKATTLPGSREGFVKFKSYDDFKVFYDGFDDQERLAFILQAVGSSPLSLRAMDEDQRWRIALTPSYLTWLFDSKNPLYSEGCKSAHPQDRQAVRHALDHLPNDYPFRTQMFLHLDALDKTDLPTNVDFFKSKLK
ncbi:hypothetical protein SCHPADRAFT_948162 [Schizopora paradoxa]|uniref:Uncharacterized protein n=1 Tax=Schizopora paradoxa TaxID=27342 RepID=A0A0H2RGA3_9AGAM|nr:hypothetical protein SCHPADRAFT_948162 [Schizopora paradoxa]